MITFLCALVDHLLGSPFTGWVYVMPVITDLVILGKIEEFKWK